MVRFLEGQDDSILERLRAKMDRASAAREFELAARLRDREDRLRELRDRITSFGALLEGLSFVYRVPPEHDQGQAGDRGYLILKGRVLHSFTFSRGTEWKGGVRSALERASAPGTAIDATSREETFLVARWFTHRPDERERTVDLADVL